MAQPPRKPRGRTSAAASTAPTDPSKLAVWGSAVSEWVPWAMETAKVVVHYGFIPLVIVVGMNFSEPKVSLGDVLNPF